MVTLKRGGATEIGQKSQLKWPSTCEVQVGGRGDNKPTHLRKNIKKKVSKVSPKSKENTPELQRILRRIKEKKNKSDSSHVIENDKNKNMSILKENKNESEVMNKKKVSILKEKFESYGQNSENIVVKCRSDILKNAREIQTTTV